MITRQRQERSLQRAFRKSVVGVLAGVLSATMMLAGVSAATADSAPVNPADPKTPVTMTADALPTVQIDGVVWQQIVLGNTVYAAGDFSTARPAGSPEGVNTVTRNNILAYDIRTGELLDSFAPDLNGEAVAITASPDGSRIYVGGSFTAVNGAKVWRVAALDAATGALIPGFAPKMDASVRAIVARGDRVYLGGVFSAVGTVSRSKLAAFNAADGTLLDWNPVANTGRVNALSLSPDGAKMVVGGTFTTLNGSSRPGFGLGAVDTAAGANLAFPINDVVRNGSDHGSITSLTSDGTYVYGSGYTFGRTSTLEGIFSVRWSDFSTNWIEDCHGDTYSVYAAENVIYAAGHSHYCGNLGGFPQENPWSFNRGVAFSKQATQKLTADPHGYTNFEGTPAPSLLNWFPSIIDGTFTGQSQGAWSVAGNADYVVMGGEFPTVNGRAQQGLVRFTTREKAPNLRGPKVTGSNFNPTLVSPAAGTVRVRWQANWDQDNKNLTYSVLRDAATVFTVAQESTFWERPSMSYLDTGLTPGRSYRYRITATDPTGNIVRSDYVNITASATTPAASAYEKAVQADKPGNYWRLGEAAGARTGFDSAGLDDLAAGTGVVFGADGALADDPNTAATFPGTTAGILSNPTRMKRPNTFSTEAWIRTTSTTGGKIIGFGNMANTLSDSMDRHVYMDNTGKLWFGVSPNRVKQTVSTTTAFNDGQWHHVVATLGAAGMQLYVDGALAASKAEVTSADAYDGFWRIGGDNLSGWPGRPTNRYFTGSIDDVAVYPAQLSAAAVARHYNAGKGTPAPNTPPQARFTSTVNGLAVSLDASSSSDAEGPVASYAWNFGDSSTGSGATAAHTYTAAGTYPVTLTVTDGSGATATVTNNVTVQAPAAAPFAVADTFGRTQSGGLGTADKGGAWTLSGGASAFSVSDGRANVTMSRTGWGATASLMSQLSDQTDAVVEMSQDKAADGGGVFASLIGRAVPDAGDYRIKAKAAAGANVILTLTRTVGGTETVLATRTLTGVRQAAGETLNLRVRVTGTNPTVLSGKAWKAGTAEPDWQVTATDTSAPLQRPGGVGVQAYLASTATNAPVTMRFDNLAAAVPAADVPAPEPANVAPVAVFSATATGLTAALDGSASRDTDGTVSTYAWDFGDGSTGTGEVVSHTYRAAGTYPVSLTVTDNDGATHRSTSPVTVAAVQAGAVLGKDSFNRTVAGGLGTADTGGPWSLNGAAANFSVAAAAARLQMPKAGAGGGAFLPGVMSTNAQSSVLASLDRIPTGGGGQLALLGRRIDAQNDYRATAKVSATGWVTLDLSRVLGGTSTTLGTQSISGLKLAAGEQLRMKISVTSGAAGTTTLQAKVWKDGTTEPAAWQVSATDTSTALQAPGSPGINAYTSASATNAPVTASFSAFEVVVP